MLRPSPHTEGHHKLQVTVVPVMMAILEGRSNDTEAFRQIHVLEANSLTAVRVVSGADAPSSDEVWWR